MGGIGKIAGGIIKQVAPKVLQAVAPAATKLLKGITDGFVNKGADFLKTTLGKLNLPNPISSLAGKLIGKGADMLKNLGGGLIEKGLSKLTEMITKRFAPGAGNVSVPGLATPERQAAIAANTPATSSSSSAASGPNPTANTSGGGSGAPAGASSAPNTPPSMPTNWEDKDQVERYQRGMQAYQAAMQGMQAYFTMMSNIIKSQGDTAKQIIGNFR